MISRRDLFRRLGGAVLGVWVMPAVALPEVASRHNWYGVEDAVTGISIRFVREWNPMLTGWPPVETLQATFNPKFLHVE